MTNLNSVLLEGKITQSAHEMNGLLYFELESLRTVKKDGAIGKERSTFNIMSPCIKHKDRLKKGLTVRLIGYLTARKSTVWVMAENIEISPMQEKYQ